MNRPTAMDKQAHIDLQASFDIEARRDALIRRVRLTAARHDHWPFLGGAAVALIWGLVLAPAIAAAIQGIPA